MGQSNEFVSMVLALVASPGTVLASTAMVKACGMRTTGSSTTRFVARMAIVNR